MIRAQSDFCIPVLCFLTGGGVVGNFEEPLPLLLFSTAHGGVVGGVVNLGRPGSWVTHEGGLEMTGGERVKLGDGGGIEPMELRLKIKYIIISIACLASVENLQL